MIELEKTYLAKYLPKDLKEFKYVKDIYIPETIAHPTLRIRKNGNNLEITKKTPLDNRDFSKQLEQTIPLDLEEYKTLEKIKGKIVEKIRYIYKYKKYIAEIDVFQKKLFGLVLVDFEFTTPSDLKEFKIPDFCLAEVTDEEFLAGGKLCGKSYKDIESKLKKYNYIKITNT